MIKQSIYIKLTHFIYDYYHYIDICCKYHWAKHIYASNAVIFFKQKISYGGFTLRKLPKMDFNIIYIVFNNFIYSNNARQVWRFYFPSQDGATCRLRILLFYF